MSRKCLGSDCGMFEKCLRSAWEVSEEYRNTGEESEEVSGRCLGSVCGMSEKCLRSVCEVSEEYPGAVWGMLVKDLMPHSMSLCTKSFALFMSFLYVLSCHAPHTLARSERSERSSARDSECVH